MVTTEGGTPHRIQNAEDTAMKYEVTINNYQKGAQLKTAMPDHVILLEKIDRNHHRVVYELENDRQRQFIEKVFARKLRPLD